MKTIEEYRAIGKELEENLLLRSSPIAIKMLMMGAQFITGEPVTASFDVVGACIQAIVPVLNGEKDYNFTVPDDSTLWRSQARYESVEIRALQEA